MCGIFGTFGLPDDGSVSGGLDLLAHRGPDGRGEVAVGRAVHGHVRLSLVDLTDASAQPFRRGGGVLSWVGEVWNHDEVRVELRSLGERFSTTGDTEVLAAAISRWGLVAALPRLEGMFALAWSDSKGDWLAVDRYGKVPLHVVRRGSEFTWSSEVKALVGAADGKLAVPMPPGSILDLSSGRLTRWYSLPSEPGEVDVLESLRAGVAARLLADAPVCCLISGGLDSSLILQLAVEAGATLVAYTSYVDPASADLAAARRFCRELGVELVEVRVDPPTAGSLSEAALVIEVSSKAQVEIAAMCLPLARRIAADGFKACLSGEAADELFGGYGNSCIRAARLDDDGWREHRRFLLAKMARGNFPRCNKAFMSAGVECRLPFMERSLVEYVLSLGKGECPPGKGLLKLAAREAGLPAWLVSRQKETFQGGSGMAAAAASVVADPRAFYAAELRRAYGRLVTW